jgi:hypothetical protein
VVSTAGRLSDPEAVPLAATVITALWRLSQTSWGDAEGSAKKMNAVRSHSATA